MSFPKVGIFGVLIFVGGLSLTVAQESPSFTKIERLAGGEVVLQLTTPADEIVRLDTSTNIEQWEGIITLLSSVNRQFTDLDSQNSSRRFYRATVLDDEQALTGDHLITSEGEAVIHIVDHASFVISWNGMMIYNDPVGSDELYSGIPPANLILVSHRHGDHFSNATLESVRMQDTVIVAPPDVFGRMTGTLQAITTSLPNGETTNPLGTTIEAVPAYNDRHTQGEGNSYILTLGDKRLFMSGDTEDVSEMRAMTNIDMAFIAMNLPFTMSVTQAASAVREFQPKVIYPYHYRNQDGTFADLNDFKNQVGSDLNVEVRLRDWYCSQ
jgi:L-ascorbate metabolism protein UlaG (beta-lactamase superfamily)